MTLYQFDFGNKGESLYGSLTHRRRVKPLSVYSVKDKLMFATNISSIPDISPVEFYGEERYIINRYNDSIFYKRNLEILCGEKETVNVYQESDHLNQHLKSSVNYSKVYRSKWERTYNTMIYSLSIKEKFKNKKLVEISIKEGGLTDDYGREVIGKQLNSTSFYHFYTENSRCLNLELPK